MARHIDSDRSSSATRAKHWVATVVLLIAVCIAPPAQAASSLTVVDTSRTAWAFFSPVSITDWRGVVNVTEAVVTDTRSTMNKQSFISFNLWRRACDVTGCLESVMSTVNAPVTTSQWADSLTQARISASSTPVRMQRFRVSASELTMIDDVVVLVPVMIFANRVAVEFSQTSTARGSGVVTTSRLLRVSAQARVDVASLTLESTQGSLTSSSNLSTTATAVKARR